MWYEDAIKQLGNEIFTRKDLFLALQKVNPNLTYNSFKWIFPQLLSKQLIYRIDFDAYSQSEDIISTIYTPLYSKKAQILKEMIEEEYPLAEFCIFESFLLNEFLNHQIANNTIIVQIEKELGAFLFDFLNEVYEGRILYKPNLEDFQRYWCEGCVIILNRVSEAPKDKQNPHDICIEKLLVDIFAEPVIRSLFSPSEYPMIVDTALERYFVDDKKLMRYAKRRSAVDKIKGYMK